MLLCQQARGGTCGDRALTGCDRSLMLACRLGGGRQGYGVVADRVFLYGLFPLHGIPSIRCYAQLGGDI